MWATNSPSASGGITQYSILRFVIPFFSESAAPSRNSRTPRSPTPPPSAPAAATSSWHNPGRRPEPHGDDPGLLLAIEQFLHRRRLPFDTVQRLAEAALHEVLTELLDGPRL